jgi:hypothetical protein
MALKSWLASIKSDVTGVTPLQAPIQAGLRCNGIAAADVTSIMEMGGKFAVENSATVTKNQTLQPEPACAFGCTVETVVTAGKNNIEAHVADELLAGDLLTTEPKRTYRPLGPQLTSTDQLAAQAYHAHHFRCRTCIAAGRGTRFGQRCSAGLILWDTYSVG